MELSLSHTLRLFNIFRENDGKENCAQVLEEELHRMLGIKYLTARSKDIPSSANLPGNGARKELDVYYTTFFL